MLVNSADEARKESFEIERRMLQSAFSEHPMREYCQVIVHSPSPDLLRKYIHKEHFIHMNLNIQRMKLDLGANVPEKGNLKQCLPILESGEELAKELSEQAQAEMKVRHSVQFGDSTINQEQETIMDAREAEIDAHFVGQTVGLFRGYVGADNCSAVNLTTVIQDGANWNTNQAIVGGSKVIGIGDAENDIHAKGTGIFGIRDVYNPHLNQIESLHLIVPELNYMKKAHKHQTDRRIISQTRLRDAGMPLKQRAWRNKRDVVECERSGYKIICTDTQGIQGIRTFHVDARKLWERPGVQEICKLVEEGKISPLVRIKQNPVFSIQPVPNLSQGQDFLPAQVQTLKQ